MTTLRVCDVCDNVVTRVEDGDVLAICCECVDSAKDAYCLCCDAQLGCYVGPAPQFCSRSCQDAYYDVCDLCDDLVPGVIRADDDAYACNACFDALYGAPKCPDCALHTSLCNCPVPF